MRDNCPPIPHRIANWWLLKTLGSGFSGSTFQARHIHTGQIVALKVQYKYHECPTNQYERHVYPALQAAKGMPTYWGGGQDGNWDYIAIDLLGSSLDQIHRMAGGPARPMDIGTVCCIAMQMIERLQLMHARGILHRDIQLGNAVVGLQPNHQLLYMIDFGFSKRYIDPYSRRHIPDSRAKRDFVGNYWFSSVNVHCLGRVPSRRDDLESCALMLIHLLTPFGLRWTREVPKTDAAHTRLKHLKRNTGVKELCRGLPIQFEEFLRYCRSLRFAEQPDYDMWIEEFRDLKVSRGYEPGDAFVWPPPQPKPLAPLVAVQPHFVRQSGGVDRPALANILNNLAKLDLNNKGQPNDKEVEASLLEKTPHIQKNQLDNHNSSPKRRNTSPPSVIEISDGSEVVEDEPPPPAYTETESKACRINKLVKCMSEGASNANLGTLMREFIAALQCNSSRTLTREAILFLDTLCKHLKDSSVIGQRARTRADKTELRESGSVKLGVVARLRKEVGHAKSSQSLAEMVEDFRRVTDRRSGRTITKDGFAFLEGLAEKLMLQQQ